MTANLSVNTDRLQAALVGSLRAARSGGQLPHRYTSTRS